MPTIGTNGQVSIPSTQTIGQVFQQKGLWAWWEQNNGKGTNMFDGVSEKGIDYSTTWGTPIAVPVGGQILRIVPHTNSIGDVVELQAADGGVWLYQHITAKVKVNQTLGVGGVIGTENGLPVDQYSTGPHIEVRYCMPGTWNPGIDSWFEPWVNPYSLFSQLSNQSASGKIDSGGLLGLLPGGITNISNPLAANANVTDLLISLDQLGVIKNPFDTSQDNVQQVWGVDNPVSWLGAVGTNLFTDTRSILIRFLLIAIGAALFYQSLKKFVDVGAIVNAGVAIGKTAAML